ncbi:hypothetical protein [Butyrivibrio virus Ceridwen]|nr:hypothetical protein [Butyrivibrio virus Ceridwen]
MGTVYNKNGGGGNQLKKIKEASVNQSNQYGSWSYTLPTTRQLIGIKSLSVSGGTSTGGAGITINTAANNFTVRATVYNPDARNTISVTYLYVDK